ncbi:ATP-dependent DNA ligase [Streptomyces sp. NPDC004561]
MHEHTSSEIPGRTTSDARFNNRLQAWQPMTAVYGSWPPPGRRNAYAYESMTNGRRVLAHLTANGRAYLISSTGDDITAAHPELAHLPGLAGGREAVFDAEVVTPDTSGHPTSPLLQAMTTRSAEAGAPTVSSQRQRTHLVICDVLYAGRPLLRLPYIQRRALLGRLVLPVEDARIAVSSCWPQALAHELATTDLRPHGYTGMIAKHLASPYRPGCRSQDWVTTAPV